MFFYAKKFEKDRTKVRKIADTYIYTFTKILLVRQHFRLKNAKIFERIHLLGRDTISKTKVENNRNIEKILKRKYSQI